MHRHAKAWAPCACACARVCACVWGEGSSGRPIDEALVEECAAAALEHERCVGSAHRVRLDVPRVDEPRVAVERARRLVVAHGVARHHEHGQVEPEHARAAAGGRVGAVGQLPVHLVGVSVRAGVRVGGGVRAEGWVKG